MTYRNLRRYLCLSSIWLVISSLCHVFSPTHGGLTLSIHRRFAVYRMGIHVKNDILLINNGEKGEIFRNLKLFRKTAPVLSSSLNRFELTWQALNHDEDYQLTITSGNRQILNQPSINVPEKGTVSKVPQIVEVVLKCRSSGRVNIHFSLNYTHFKATSGKSLHRKLDFTISKICGVSFQPSSDTTSNGKAVNRVTVVSASASFALIVCLVLAFVFFCRRLKGRGTSFTVNDEAREHLSPHRESFTSPNTSVEVQSHVPTVVYSPKLEKSCQLFTRIAKHEKPQRATSPKHECNVRSLGKVKNEQTSPLSLNGQFSNRNSKFVSEAARRLDDNVTISDEMTPEENDTLILAKETSDKELAFSTLNEYWSDKLYGRVTSNQVLEINSEVLEEGTFSRVLRGKLIISCEQPESNIDLAVKICHKDVDFDEMISFVNEAIVMKNLQHENILTLLGVVFQTCAPPYILTPYMQHGDLLKFLRHSRGIGIRRQLIGSKQLVNFGGQIAKGMEYLASQQIVHRDLATRNCFVDQDLNVKIGDFGLAREAKQFDLYKMEHPAKLAVKWLALESLLYYIFNEKSDVWSFGIVLWELVTLGSQPYAGLDNYEVLPYLENGTRLPRPLRCPDDLYSIMQSCWLPMPEERPTFSILLHKLEDYELRLRPSCVTFEFDEDTIEMSDGLC